MAATQAYRDLPFGVAAAPLPGRNADHLITTHLPYWDDVERFIKQDPTLFNNVVNFYPRVIPQAQVRNLCKGILDRVEDTKDQTCMIFNDPAAPQTCIDFLSSPKRGDKRVPREQFQCRAFDLGPQRLFVVFHPMAQGRNTAEFWQTPGVGVSTRQAEEALKYLYELKEIPLDSERLSDSAEADTSAQKLRQRIVDVVNRAALTNDRRPAASDVYLFPTGMSVFYRIHNYLLSTYNLPSVTFGFPFHNTKDLFDYYEAPDHLFLGNGDEHDLETLKTHLANLQAQGKKIQALWTEFPANPSCVTPDLKALRQLADQYKFILIVDDTVAGTANVDCIASADILITSLTKSFSGYADVMGGSAVLNPASPFYNDLKAILTKQYRNELHHADATILLTNSNDYLHRSAVYNRNGAALANFFQSESQKPNSIIRKVYHPLTLPSRSLYEAHIRPSTPDFTPGHGLLLSVEFTTVEAEAAFYDKLEMIKSPHLGAHVTLVLPYIKGIFGMLGQLEEIKKWDLRETQLRIAPGLEDTEELLRKFREAVEGATKALGEEH